MHFLKLTSLCFATAGMLLAAFSFASGSDHEDDLLDPTLDQPLPQYESTSVPGFGELPKAVAPKAVIPIPKTVAPKNQDVKPKELELPASGRGTELAPNPLQSLLSGQATEERIPEEQGSPSDIQAEEPERVVPKANPKSNPNPNPKSKSKSKYKAKAYDRAPVIESGPIDEEPGKLTELPGYSSPFNPKPLVPSSPTGGFKKPSKAKASTSPANSKEKQKSSATKKSAAKKKQIATALPELNYEIYRDQSAYPIDPRKPNNPCTQTQNCGCSACLAGKTGVHGRPHQPREPGGYACGKNCSNKRPQFSAYWPQPLSAKRDERNPECAQARYSGCQQKKLTDCFDRLANFRLIDYQRTDNGYCGPERDPYGCLGESKIASRGYYVPFQTQAIPQADSYPLR